MLGVYSGRKLEARTFRALFLYKILEGGMLTKANTKLQTKGRSRYTRYMRWGLDKPASTMLCSIDRD